MPQQPTCKFCRKPPTEHLVNHEFGKLVCADGVTPYETDYAAILTPNGISAVVGRPVMTGKVDAPVLTRPTVSTQPPRQPGDAVLIERADLLELQRPLGQLPLPPALRPDYDSELYRRG